MLSWIFGGSTPDPVPVQVAKFINPKVVFHETYITVSFQPFTDSNGEVQLATNPDFGPNQNPFASIVKKLSANREEHVVFTEIKAVHVCNEFDVTFEFRIKNIFDYNPDQIKKDALVGVDMERVRVKWGGVEDPLNEVETGNEFVVVVPASTDDKVSEDWELLYDCTLSEELISKFAGQYSALTSIPPQKEGMQDRIFPEDHPMVLFIKACREPLEVTTDNFKERPSERDSDIKVYIISDELIEDAKGMLKTTIYSKMFSTTMKDTAMVVSVDSDDDVTLKKKWADRCNVNNRYRPTVSFTLKMQYYKVDPRKPKSNLRTDVTRYL